MDMKNNINLNQEDNLETIKHVETDNFTNGVINVTAGDTKFYEPFKKILDTLKENLEFIRACKEDYESVANLEYLQGVWDNIKTVKELEKYTMELYDSNEIHLFFNYSNVLSERLEEFKPEIPKAILANNKMEKSSFAKKKFAKMYYFVPLLLEIDTKTMTQFEVKHHTYQYWLKSRAERAVDLQKQIIWDINRNPIKNYYDDSRVYDLNGKKRSFLRRVWYDSEADNELVASKMKWAFVFVTRYLFGQGGNSDSPTMLFMGWITVCATRIAEINLLKDEKAWRELEFGPDWANQPKKKGDWLSPRAKYVITRFIIIGVVVYIILNFP